MIRLGDEKPPIEVEPIENPIRERESEPSPT